MFYHCKRDWVKQFRVYVRSLKLNFAAFMCLSTVPRDYEPLLTIINSLTSFPSTQFVGLHHLMVLISHTCNLGIKVVSSRAVGGGFNSQSGNQAGYFGHSKFMWSQKSKYFYLPITKKKTQVHNVDWKENPIWMDKMSLVVCSFFPGSLRINSNSCGIVLFCTAQ